MRIVCVFLLVNAVLWCNESRNAFSCFFPVLLIVYFHNQNLCEGSLSTPHFLPAFDQCFVCIVQLHIDLVRCLMLMHKLGVYCREGRRITLFLLHV